jgi:hypothetical protein
VHGVGAPGADFWLCVALQLGWGFVWQKDVKLVVMDLASTANLRRCTCLQEDTEVASLYSDLLSLPGFGSMGGPEEGDDRGGAGARRDDDPVELQKSLDGWRDVASRVDVPLQSWFRLCGGVRCNISMRILGTSLQGPVFFFPLRHLASATRLTVRSTNCYTAIHSEWLGPSMPWALTQACYAQVDMLRRPTEAELRGEDVPLVNEEAVTPQTGLEIKHGSAPEPGSGPEPEPEPEPRARSDSPPLSGIATELEPDDPPAAASTPAAAAASSPPPRSSAVASVAERVGAEGAAAVMRRRSRCPMLVTATAALGSSSSSSSAAAAAASSASSSLASSSSLLPIAVFLQSQHLVCVVLPPVGAGQRVNEAEERDAMLSTDQQLVTLQFSGSAPGGVVSNRRLLN